MTFTYTGRHVTPAGSETPSLMDIAVGLSRQPRFAGQGRRWFSVLDHSLFCVELAKRDDRSPRLQLAMLVHDGHEAITSDIPKPWKSASMGYAQEDLDIRIMEAYFPGGIGGYRELNAMVKWFDRRALVAEARVIGPPVSAERILDAFGITETVLDDVQVLEDLLESGWVGVEPTYAFDPTYHPAVRDFLNLYLELR